MGVHRPQLTKCMLHSFHLDWPFNVSSYPSTLNLLPHVLLLSSIFLPVSCLFDAECVTFPCLTHVFFFGKLCARNHCTYTEMLTDMRTCGPILYRETEGKHIWNVKHNSTQRSTAGSRFNWAAQTLLLSARSSFNFYFQGKSALNMLRLYYDCHSCGYAETYCNHNSGVPRFIGIEALLFFLLWKSIWRQISTCGIRWVLLQHVGCACVSVFHVKRKKIQGDFTHQYETRKEDEG